MVAPENPEPGIIRAAPLEPGVLVGEGVLLGVAAMVAENVGVAVGMAVCVKVGVIVGVGFGPLVEVRVTWT